MALELPARRLKDAHLTRRAAENGLNACFDETVHCLAQEPTTTVLRVAVLEGDKDVAYETCLLSSLRSGYRVLHLRSLLGTRLEGCVLFVRISRGVEPNSFSIAGEEIQAQLARSEARIKQLEAQVKTQIARQLAMSLAHEQRLLNKQKAAASCEDLATIATLRADAASTSVVSSRRTLSSRDNLIPLHRDALRTAAMAALTGVERMSTETVTSGRVEVVGVPSERAASKAARVTASEAAGGVLDLDAHDAQRPLSAPSVLDSAETTRASRLTSPAKDKRARRTTSFARLPFSEASRTPSIVSGGALKRARDSNAAKVNTHAVRRARMRSPCRIRKEIGHRPIVQWSVLG